MYKFPLNALRNVVLKIFRKFPGAYMHYIATCVKLQVP